MPALRSSVVCAAMLVLAGWVTGSFAWEQPPPASADDRAESSQGSDADEGRPAETDAEGTNAKESDDKRTDATAAEESPREESPEEYDARIERERAAREKAWREWNRRLSSQREKQRTGNVPPPPPEGTSIEEDEAAEERRTYRLEDARIPAGRYEVRSQDRPPVDVDVIPGRNALEPGEWSARDYLNAHDAAADLAGRLRELRLYLLSEDAQVDRERFAPLVTAAWEDLQSLQSVLQKSEPLDAVRHQYQAFDRSWRDLNARLIREARNDPALRRLLTAAERVDQRLDLLVRVAPGPIYDRLTVMALAQQLSVATDDLADQFALDGGRLYITSRLRELADRVEDEAESFAFAVEADAPFHSLLDQYEEFDDAWHRLVAIANPNPAVGPLLREIGRAVWAIDRHLHEALRVSPPLWSEWEGYAARVQEVRFEMESLLGELRLAALEYPLRDIPVREAERVWWAVREYQIAVNDGAPQAIVDARLARVRALWDHFRDVYSSLPPVAASPARPLVRAIEDDFARLEQGIPRS